MIDIRPVPGCPGYGASADGRIWSRRTRHGIVASYHELRPTFSRGYFVVSISRGKRDDNTSGKVGRLVYTAFNGKLPNDIDVDHIDFNTKNNTLSNLRPLTKQQNRAHTVAHGRHARGELHGIARLTDADVLAIKNAYRKGVRGHGLTIIGRRYGVTAQGVSYAIRIRFPQITSPATTGARP